MGDSHFIICTLCVPGKCEVALQMSSTVPYGYYKCTSPCQKSPAKSLFFRRCQNTQGGGKGGGLRGEGLSASLTSGFIVLPLTVDKGDARCNDRGRVANALVGGMPERVTLPNGAVPLGQEEKYGSM